jgi:hypothetical protein
MTWADPCRLVGESPLAVGRNFIVVAVNLIFMVVVSWWFFVNKFLLAWKKRRSVCQQRKGGGNEETANFGVQKTTLLRL